MASTKFQTPFFPATTVASAANDASTVADFRPPYSANGPKPNAADESNYRQQQTSADINLACRKASEAVERRYQAASWLQIMVGPLDLSPEPTEEELRLCLRNGLVLCNLINKIHPGAVPKIVENPMLKNFPPLDGAPLSAFQYFENVRNFLIVVEELKLPSFEVSDLEQGSMQKTGLPGRVVDCILSLKAYHEWQQAGGQGLWKIVGPLKPPTPIKPFSRSGCSGYSKPGIQASNRWNQAEENDDMWSRFGWLIHLCQQFVEVFLSGKRRAQETYMSSEVLLEMVMSVLHDKTSEEVPMIVEFMMKKVIEETEARFTGQSKQMPFQEPNTTLRKGQSRLQEVDQQRALQLEWQMDELQELKHALEATRLECHDMQLAWEEEMEDLDKKLQSLAHAASEYHKIAAENRELYNQVQDLKGNIRVYCRVRPFLPGQNSSQSTVDYIGEKGSITIVNPAKQGKEQRKTFAFNKTFGPSVTQEEVFLDTQPLIRSVLDGYNVCIFAYGQTGSGKTYTMTGPANSVPKDWGVNFRALNDLFNISQNRDGLINYEVGVQMIEIYNEQVRDLLSKNGANKKLEIRNNSQQNGLNVPDANMVPVRSTEDVLEVMTVGHRNRSVGATALNDRSSRSHSVLTVHVKGRDLSTGSLLRGCLHLIDLAGSERVDRSEATGERLKEAQHINKSLSALGDVVAALAHKSAHVPYRNSKLTQLLQDSLGGQAKTLMFVHISPDVESYGETISTLKFAERVATVELGAAQANKDTSDVKELKEQVAFLRDMLSKKDGELERLRESRPKGNSNGKANGEPNKRQPCEEMHPIANGYPSPDFDSADTFYGFSPEEESESKRNTMDRLSWGAVSSPHANGNAMFKCRSKADDVKSTPPRMPNRQPGMRNGNSSGNGFMKPVTERKIPLSSPSSARSGAQNPFATGKTDSKRELNHRRSSSFSYVDYSTEGSTNGKRDEFDEEDDDYEGMSDYSEAERWQIKDGESSPMASFRSRDSHSFMSKTPVPEGDQRSINQRRGPQSHSTAASTEKKMNRSNNKPTSNGGSSEARSVRNQGFSMFNGDSANPRGRSSLESKFVPAYPEKDGVDYGSKARTFGQPVTPNSSKRWSMA